MSIKSFGDSTDTIEDDLKSIDENAVIAVVRRVSTELVMEQNNSNSDLSQLLQK